MSEEELAEEEEVNQSHPNEGEIEEAVGNTDPTDSPEDAAEDDE